MPFASYEAEGARGDQGDQGDQGGQGGQGGAPDRRRLIVFAINVFLYTSLGYMLPRYLTKQKIRLRDGMIFAVCVCIIIEIRDIVDLFL